MQHLRGQGQDDKDAAAVGECSPCLLLLTTTATSRTVYSRRQSWTATGIPPFPPNPNPRLATVASACAPLVRVGLVQFGLVFTLPLPPPNYNLMHVTPTTTWHLYHCSWLRPLPLSSYLT